MKVILVGYRIVFKILGLLSNTTLDIVSPRQHSLWDDNKSAISQKVGKVATKKKKQA